MKLIHMEMQQIELRGHAADFIEHNHGVGNVVPHGRIESKGLLTAWDKSCAGKGITAGEQSDIVPLFDELLGEIGDDPFRAAVEPGRHAFDERRYLGNFHIQTTVCSAVCSRTQ